MEAKELMTGDWVIIKRTPSYEYPYKICSINNYSILGEDYADWIEVEAGEEINLEDIKAIPLTAEILEKNGFECEQMEFSRAIWDTYKISDNLYIAICGDMRVCGYYVGQLDNSDYIQDMLKIDYVHELQHALRLCGITHEISL